MKRALTRRLADLDGFEDPDVELEQYPTSPGLAANVIHLADINQDLDGTVIDLGTGTGMLALAATTRNPTQVIGLEQDLGALAIARRNAATFDTATRVHWVQADATDPPLSMGDATVVMNPPFGAQHGRGGADRAFLEAARVVGNVSYSIHNAGSREFIESFAADNRGDVTHAYASELPLAAQFEFHTSDRVDVPVEVYRIEWSNYS